MQEVHNVLTSTEYEIQTFSSRISPKSRSSSSGTLFSDDDSLRQSIHSSTEMACSALVAQSHAFLGRVAVERTSLHEEALSAHLSVTVSSLDNEDSFVAADITHMMSRVASFNDQFPGVHMLLKSGVLGDTSLAALFLHLGSTLTIDTPSDVTLLQAAIASQPGLTDKPSALLAGCAVDTTTTRSPSRAVTALAAGARIFAVDSLRSASILSEACNKLSIDTSDITLLLQLRSVKAKLTKASLTAGAPLAAARGCTLATALAIAANSSMRIGGVAVENVASLNVDDVMHVLTSLQCSLVVIEQMPEDACDALSNALHTLLSIVPSLRIIGGATEYVLEHAKSRTLCAKVIGAREVVEPSTGMSCGQQIYVGSGIYGSMCIPTSGAKAFCIGSELAPIALTSDIDAESAVCTIWGQTCDSIDKITENARLPEMRIGDWIAFPAAAGTLTSTTFNGYAPPKMRYYVDASCVSQADVPLEGNLLKMLCASPTSCVAIYA